MEGLRITNDEKEVWHEDVNVYFQYNSCADTEFAVSLVYKTLMSATERNDWSVLFCDNLSAQVTNDFKDAVSAIGGLVWNWVPNATDLWQPVDAGSWELLKVLTMQQHNCWLDCNENADCWYRNTLAFFS